MIETVEVEHFQAVFNVLVGQTIEGFIEVYKEIQEIQASSG